MAVAVKLDVGVGGLGGGWCGSGGGCVYRGTYY